jgi:predicted house-cleaning noncanonical NTP pyrophosphatase (MazG superfamily)
MSRVIEYRKLIRDKVPDILEAEGVKATYHKADHDEFEIELLEKLREEVIEFKNAKSIDELVDLLETLDTVIAFYEWKQEDIITLKNEKRAEKGGYSKQLILDKTEQE